MKKLLWLNLVLGSFIFLGCSGGDSNYSSNELSSKENSIIQESIKVEKDNNKVTVNYQTSLPVNTSKIITSNFSFNKMPLWNELHDATTSDGINHTVIINNPNSSINFMIYNSPNDKFDNNGKGILIN